MEFENNQLQLEGQRSNAGHDRWDQRLAQPKPGNAPASRRGLRLN